MTEIERYQDEIAALQEQVRALAVLAEERRGFIVNGAEVGRIEMPVFNDDPATAIYQRCLLKPEFAADAALREIRAQGVDALRDSIPDIDNGIENTIDLHHYCTDFAASIRTGEQQ